MANLRSCLWPFAGTLISRNKIGSSMAAIYGIPLEGWPIKGFIIKRGVPRNTMMHVYLYCHFIIDLGFRIYSNKCYTPKHIMKLVTYTCCVLIQISRKKWN